MCVGDRLMLDHSNTQTKTQSYLSINMYKRFSILFVITIHLKAVVKKLYFKKYRLNFCTI